MPTKKKVSDNIVSETSDETITNRELASATNSPEPADPVNTPLEEQPKTVTGDQLQTILDEAPDFPALDGSAESFLRNQVEDFKKQYDKFYNDLVALLT